MWLVQSKMCGEESVKQNGGFVATNSSEFQGSFCLHGGACDLFRIDPVKYVSMFVFWLSSQPATLGVYVS